MQKLDRSSLWSLEAYAEQRPAFRAEVIAHKKPRRVLLNDHATLIFEDFLTMKYQVQEMLRVERIFEADAIQEEIDAYNPLIPDGGNWKATLQIEFPDVEERRTALARMPGVEHKIWAQVDGHDRIFAIANEDLDRSTEEKTSAVHFLRFELPADAIAALRSGAGLRFGIDHPALSADVAVSEETRASLIQDFD